MGLTAVLAPLFPELDRALRPEDSPATLASWDSFRQAEIVLAVEEAFGIDLTTREILEADSVGALARILRARGIEVED